MYYTNFEKKLLEKLIFQLQNIEAQTHEFGEIHIPFHQHKRFSGILYAAIRKIQAYQEFQLIDTLNDQFWELQEPIYNFKDKAQRMQHALGAVNVKLMLYLRAIKNDKRWIINYRNRNI